MKLYEILGAKQALANLLDKRFVGFKVVRELANLRKAVETEVDFYMEQERKIVQEYAQKDKNGDPVILENGRIQLKDAESKTAFEREILALRDLEVDKIIPVTVSESDFKEGSDIPTPNELLALECIVTFA